MPNIKGQISNKIRNPNGQNTFDMESFGIDLAFGF
jgi:hypothetical protein